jgi:hypothetical protein
MCAHNLFMLLFNGAPAAAAAVAAVVLLQARQKLRDRYHRSH